jgi:hypothetical protein
VALQDLTGSSSASSSESNEAVSTPSSSLFGRSFRNPVAPLVRRQFSSNAADRKRDKKPPKTANTRKNKTAKTQEEIGLDTLFAETARGLSETVSGTGTAVAAVLARGKDVGKRYLASASLAHFTGAGARSQGTFSGLRFEQYRESFFVGLWAERIREFVAANVDSRGAYPRASELVAWCRVAALAEVEKDAKISTSKRLRGLHRRGRSGSSSGSGTNVADSASSGGEMAPSSRSDALSEDGNSSSASAVRRTASAPDPGDLAAQVSTTLRMALAAILTLGVEHNEAKLVSECLREAGVHAADIVNTICFKDYPVLFLALSRPVSTPELGPLIQPETGANSVRNMAQLTQARKEILTMLVRAGADLSAVIAQKTKGTFNCVEHFLDGPRLRPSDHEILEHFLGLVAIFGLVL